MLWCHLTYSNLKLLTCDYRYTLVKKFIIGLFLLPEKNFVQDLMEACSLLTASRLLSAHVNHAFSRSRAQCEPDDL